MATKEESIQNLLAARDYLAADHWTQGMGFAEDDVDYDGKTCALGGLARAFGWKQDGDTDSAIAWLLDNDGDALIALAKAIPDRTDPSVSYPKTWKEAKSYSILLGEDLSLERCASLVYGFNDRQFNSGPVLKLFEDAVAIMQAE